jgi:hypothetical protein
MSDVKLESLVPEKPEIKYGWECPKCGAVMAPHVNVCVNCSGNHVISINTNAGTISPYLNPIGGITFTND